MSTEKNVIAFLERFRGSLSHQSYVRMIEAGAECIRNDIDAFNKELFASKPKKAKKTTAEPPVEGAAPSSDDAPADNDDQPGRAVTIDEVLLHLKTDGGELSVGEIRKQLSAEAGHQVDGGSVSKAIKALVKDGRVLWTGGAKRAAKYTALNEKRAEETERDEKTK